MYVCFSIVAVTHSLLSRCPFACPPPPPALSAGEAERSLDKARSVLRTVEGLTEGDLPGKVQFVATLHSCIGSAQMELGQSEDALEHHLKDHAISRELGSEEGVARAQENLVKVYMQMGEYQEALEQ